MEETARRVESARDWVKTGGGIKAFRGPRVKQSGGIPLPGGVRQTYRDSRCLVVDAARESTLITSPVLRSTCPN